MSTDAPVALYELVLEDGRSASPYVWRIRYALAHKGIAFASRPVGFTEIPQLFGGRFKTVPILEHGTTVLNESWQIAEYLDRTFPQRPLFASASENAMVRLTDAWLAADVLRRMFFIYVLDVHNAARPADRAYFRASREQWLQGTSLEKYPERILVVIELAGGNDGLNTVVPYSDPAYYHARPKLGIAERSVIKAADGFGFHPSMVGFERLYKDGLLAVVHGCGPVGSSFSGKSRTQSRSMNS